MILTQILSDSVSWLDSMIIVTHVKNVLAEKVFTPESNLLKDYGVPFFAAIVGVVTTLLAFYLARRAVVFQQYTYYVNLQKYVDIYFQEFDTKKTEARKIHYNNVKHLSDVLRLKPEIKSKISFKNIEYDTGRILNLTQSDSYHIFVNLKNCISPSDKDKLHKAYNSILFNMKVLKDSGEAYEKWIIENKKLGSVGEVIRTNVAIFTHEIMKLRIDDSIPKKHLDILRLMFIEYGKELFNPTRPAYHIHDDYAKSIGEYCVNNYASINPIHNIDLLIQTNMKIRNGIIDWYSNVKSLYAVIFNTAKTIKDVQREIRIDYGVVKSFENKSPNSMFWEL